MSRDRGREPLWTGGFLAATVVNFLLNVVFYLLMTTMAVYAIDRFAADEVLAGLTSSAYVFGALISRLAATAVIERFGARRVYLVTATAATLASGLYFVADGLTVLLVARVIHGLGFGFAHSAIGGMTQARVPATRRGEGNGFFAMSATVGAAIGPLLAVLLTRGGDFLPLFTGATFASLGALLAGALIRPLPADEAPTARQRSSRTLLARPAVPIGIVAFLQSLGYAAVVAFLAEYAGDLGTPDAAGWFFLVYAACVVLVRAVSGRLYDRFGPDVIMYPGLILYAGGLILLAAVPSAAAILLAAVIIGVGYGALLPVGMAIASERMGPAHPGGSFATFYLFVDLGYGAGPVALGFALGMWGWSGMLVTAAATVALAAGMYTAVARPRRPQLSDR